MKKLFLLMGVAGLLTFASCGGEATTETTETTETPVEAVEETPVQEVAADSTAADSTASAE